jgi:ribosomal 30S subunit maturation factor RimM
MVSKTQTPQSEYVVVAKIGAPYGVRGWVKIFSFTEQVDALLDYDPWYFNDPKAGEGDLPIAPVTEAKTYGKGLVAKFKGCDDRDAAARLNGREIVIRRDQLPPTEEGEYYWSDLQGLEVLTTEGQGGSSSGNRCQRCAGGEGRSRTADSLCDRSHRQTGGSRGRDSAGGLGCRF